MTTISLNVNSVSVSVNLPVGASTPDMSRFPVPHDFILNNQPHAFKRFGCGELMVSKGAEVMTDMGMGFIEFHKGSNEYCVRIVDFDSEYSFSLVSGKRLSAQDWVAFLSNAHNRQVLAKSAWWLSDMDDKKTAEKVLDQMIDDDCYFQAFTAQSGYGGAIEFAYTPVYIESNVSEPIIKKVERKRKVRSTYIPAEIAAEVDADFGAFDDTDFDDDVDPISEEE
jgi:hypothetical protein